MRSVAALISLALVASAVGIGAITVAATTTTTAANAAGGSSIVTETFGGSSVSDSRWIGLGAACLTAATSTASSGSNLGSCSKTTDSAYLTGQTPGFLQLTDNSEGSTGDVLLNRAIPSRAGLDVSFYQYQFATTGTGLGNADGIGFFLIDGSYSLTSPGPTGAGYGGALGYASYDTQAGVGHGVLGVGLDAYGYYSWSAIGGSTCASSGPLSNSVVIRGAGNGTTGYCLLSNHQLTSSDPQIVTSAPAVATAGQDNGTLVRMVVSPTTDADPYPTVTVYLNGTEVTSYTMTTALPSTVKLGFSSSTGAGHDVHLIRAVTVSSVDSLGAVSLAKTVDHSSTDGVGTQATTFTTGDSVPYSFTVTNTGAETLNDIVVTDPKITTISCPATSLEPASAMTCTGTYSSVTEAEAAAGEVDNTATVTAVNTDGNSVTGTASAKASTYTTANFSVTKVLTGTGASLAASGTTYSVNYTYPAGSYKYCSADGTATASDTSDTYVGGPGTLTVKAGQTVSSGQIPTGATLTLSETTPSAVTGATWSSPVFSSNTVTIGCASTTQNATLTNTLVKDDVSYTVSKSVDPVSGTTVEAGDTLTYTLAFTSTGTSAATVAAVDDLSGVLDDATITSGPSVSNASLTAAVTGTSLAVTGTLPVGATYTVTYQVKVNAYALQGDHDLRNTVASSNGGIIPPGGGVTDNPVADLVVTKTADPASGTEVKAGQTVTYTVSFQNVSTSADAAAQAVAWTDNLSGVLDDATLNTGSVTASSGLTAIVDGTNLNVTGQVASGVTATVTYQVTVKSYTSQGNHSLVNYVTPTGQPGSCVTGSRLCTTNPVTAPTTGLADTTATSLAGAGGIGALLLLAGLALVWAAKRRRGNR